MAILQQLPIPRLEEPRPQTFRIELSVKTMLAILLVLFGVWLVIQLSPVVLVLVTALILAGTFSPLVERLENRGVGRGLAVAIVFVAFGVSTLLLLGLTIPALLSQALDLMKQEPEFRARAVSYLERSSLTAPLAEALRNLKYQALAENSAGTALAISTQAMEVVAYGVSAIFLSLYLLIDRDRLRGALFAVVPRSHHIRLSRVLVNLVTIVSGYIRGQAITSGLMAVVTFILLVACGVPHALPLAVFAGLADVLPYVGGIIAMVPAGLAALARGPVTAMVVVAVMMVYQELESRVVVPRVYGKALRLPSFVVILALLAGGTLMGIVGALLALPVAAALLMLIEELRVELPGESEQVEDVEVREKDDRGEQEYERRTEGLPAEQAAAIAVEMSGDRKKEEAEELKVAEAPEGTT